MELNSICDLQDTELLGGSIGFTEGSIYGRTTSDRK